MLSIMRLSNFNSIKVRLRLAASEGVQVACGFQFHKGTIKTDSFACNQDNDHNFNSIKVRLRPIVFGYIISLFSIGFTTAKLINLIEKMSMGDYIFLCVLRQPLIILGVTTSQRSK